MTVCIGAICEDGNTAIVASDRMVTARRPPIQFEHPKPKIYSLSPYCVVLSAGNALKPIEVTTKSGLVIAEKGKPPPVGEISEIVKQYLIDNGYDGLFYPDGECACEISDLMPCGEWGSDCEPGYKIPCPGDCDLEPDCLWHIVKEKP